jgi:hypothetical protein
VAVEFGSLAVARLLLTKGPYIAMMSPNHIQDELKAGTLFTVHVPELKRPTPGVVVFPAGVPLMPAARQFLDLLQTVYAETGDAAGGRRRRRGRAPGGHRAPATPVIAAGSPRAHRARRR